MRSPHFATVQTLLAIVAGLFGSLYTSEIRSAFAVLHGQHTVEWHAGLFWFSAALTAAMFFIRQRAVDSDRRNEQTELADLLRTLPPSDFLSAFHEVFKDCSAVLAQVWRTDDTNQASLCSAIQTVLGGIADLARSFDGRPVGVTYCSNLMFYRPTASIPVGERAAVEERLRFVEPGIVLDALAGVLDLDVELSASLYDTLSRPDPKISPLALPVPEQHRSDDGRRSRVLPGAPRAFCERVLDGYSDSRTLGQWCRDEKEFSETVAQQIEGHFLGVTGSAVRSFVSLPVYLVDKVDPVAVLNIHSDKIGLLKGTGTLGDTPGQFSILAGPCVAVLAFLLERLPEAGVASHGREGNEPKPGVGQGH